MMQSCDQCPEWAQWTLLESTPVSDDQRKKDEAAKLHPRGAEWKRVGQLCGLHKELAKLEPNQRVRFVGAISP